MARQGPTFYSMAACILKLDVNDGVEDGSLSFSAMIFWLICSMWNGWTPMGVLMLKFTDFRGLIFEMIFEGFVL